MLLWKPTLGCAGQQRDPPPGFYQLWSCLHDEWRTHKVASPSTPGSQLAQLQFWMKEDETLLTKFVDRLNIKVIHVSIKCSWSKAKCLSLTTCQNHFFPAQENIRFNLKSCWLSSTEPTHTYSILLLDSSTLQCICVCKLHNYCQTEFLTPLAKIEIEKGRPAKHACNKYL